MKRPALRTEINQVLTQMYENERNARSVQEELYHASLGVYFMTRMFAYALDTGPCTNAIETIQKRAEECENSTRDISLQIMNLWAHSFELTTLIAAMCDSNRVADDEIKEIQNEVFEEGDEADTIEGRIAACARGIFRNYALALKSIDDSEEASDYIDEIEDRMEDELDEVDDTYCDIATVLEACCELIETFAVCYEGYEEFTAVKDAIHDRYNTRRASANEAFRLFLYATEALAEMYALLMHIINEEDPTMVPNWRADVYAKPQNPLAKLKKQGCYVATSVYGSYDCPEVWTLRRYRDDTLGATWYGRLFIRIYYAISPTLVKWFGETAWFRRFWRGKLDRMVKKLQSKGVESTPYEDKEW